jgi:large subunit ribosomal protein L10
MRAVRPLCDAPGGVVVSAADRSDPTGTTTTEDDVARPDKVAAVEEVKQSLSDSAATLLTHYRGLSVAELQELRAELRKANASYRVIKNTLSKRAMAEAGVDELGDLLEGPTALVFCQEDPVGPAKALKAFAKDHPDLIVRGGYLDGEVLDEAATIKLADLASREELLAELVGLMHGALANTARLLQAPLEQQGRLLQALVDAGGGAEGEAAEPAAEDETPATEDETPATAEEEPSASAEDEPAEEAAAPEASTEDAAEAADADADDEQA